MGQVLCARVFAKVRMYKRPYREMKVQGTAYGDNIILAHDVISGGYFVSNFRQSIFAFGRFISFTTLTAGTLKCPFQDLTNHIILRVDVYFHIQ